MVGVVNEKRYTLPRVFPLTAFASGSMVTSYLVANGNGVFGSGVKISVVVPDQRNVPLISGATWNQGTFSTFGILPTTIIGSRNTTRISFAWARLAPSPTGPALTMVSLSAARAATAHTKRRITAPVRFMRPRVALANPSICDVESAIVVSSIPKEDGA